jgi:N utilization substance protein B
MAGDPEPSVTPRRTDTKDPRRARRLAFKVLFQADVRSVAPSLVVEQLNTHPQFRALLAATDEDTVGPDETLDAFTHALVFGVEAKQDELDALITQFAKEWQVSRMPVVDRTVARLGAYELVYEQTPPAVAISEAVSLAKEFSTEKSSRYVNGVLEAIRSHLAASTPPSAGASGE